MTIKSVSIAAINPTTFRNVDFDGVIEDQHFNLVRNPMGGVVPVKGSILPTPYGDAQVVGYVDGSLRVRVTRFDDEFLHVIELDDDIIIQTADEFVAELACAANRAIQSEISDIYRLKASEFTGKLPKSVQAYVDSIQEFKPNEFVMDLTPKSVLPDGLEVLATFPSVERTVTVKQVRRMVTDDEDLDNDVVDDIYAELGEFDLD